MKKTILFLTVLLSLISCDKKEGEADELDPRLFEGTGRWADEYTVGANQFREELTFTADEVQKIKYQATGTWTEIDNDRMVLKPIGTKKATVTTVAATPVTVFWTYSIQGEKLTICNEDQECSDFRKIDE